MRLTNAEIIAIEANKRGYSYNGSNIHTFRDWELKGYAPIRGQKAFMKVYLWNNGTNRRKTLQGLFTVEQVTKIPTKELIFV